MVTEREQREKEHLKRDKLSGYFLDMSKLTFATSVLAGAAPIFNSDSSANIPYVLRDCFHGRFRMDWSFNT